MEDNLDLVYAQMEYLFWLQIMGDHGRFIFSALDSNDIEFMQQTQNFIIQYDDLLNKIHGKLTQEVLDIINHKTYQLTSEFKEYQIHLLTFTLNENLKLHLPSSFLNEMLNEIDEFLMVIHSIVNQDAMNLHPLHYHLIWLTDAVIHANTIATNLDIVEKDLINQASHYEVLFSDLVLKTTMLNGYLRTNLNTFPSLSRLNDQAESAIYNFKEFLDHLRDLRIDGRIQGTLNPLMVDHMAREECYYLWKLSQSVGTLKKPDCDPQRPRIEV